MECVDILVNAAIGGILALVAMLTGYYLAKREKRRDRR